MVLKGAVHRAAREEIRSGKECKCILELKKNSRGVRLKAQQRRGSTLGCQIWLNSPGVNNQGGGYLSKSKNLSGEIKNCKEDKQKKHAQNTHMRTTVNLLPKLKNTHKNGVFVSASPACQPHPSSLGFTTPITNKQQQHS